MGDAVGLSFTLGEGIIKALVAGFFAGFIPGFYLSFLLFIKKRTNLLLTLLFCFIVGAVLGGIGIAIIGNFYHPLQPLEPQNSFWNIFSNKLFLIILLEIVTIIVH